MKTYILHLDRASARRPLVDAALAQSPFPAEVISAIDGATLPAQTIAPLHRPRYPFALSPTEIAIFLSFRKVWARIIDDGAEAALVCEDDIHFQHGFAQVAHFAARHVARLGYIQFQTRRLPGPAREVTREGDLAILRHRVVPVRCTAQLIHRDTAARLLRATARFDRPVDTTLQMPWVTGVEIYTAQPSRVAEMSASTGGSTQTRRRKTLTGELRRTLQRQLYRNRIARCSARHERTIP